MATRKKTIDTAAADEAAAAVVTEPQMTHAEKGIVILGGYIPKPRTRRVVADPERYPRLSPWDDAPPFWADIRDDLTFNQMNAIPTVGKVTYQDQQKIIAPYVHAWNAWAINDESGEWEQAPPPAEAGWEIFGSQTQHVTSFLVACLKFGAGTDLPKLLSRSGSTDSGNDEPTLE